MPSSDLPNVPRRDSGSGSYWSHRVCELHISVMPSDVEFTGGGRRSGATMSGMLVRTTDDRSRVANDGCAAIVVPCCGQPIAMVARSCSMSSSAVPASNELWVTSVAPRCRVASSVVTRPPIQKNGIDENITSSPVIG